MTFIFANETSKKLLYTLDETYIDSAQITFHDVDKIIKGTKLNLLDFIFANYGFIQVKHINIRQLIMQVFVTWNICKRC